MGRWVLPGSRGSISSHSEGDGSVTGARCCPAWMQVAANAVRYASRRAPDRCPADRHRHARLQRRPDARAHVRRHPARPDRHGSSWSTTCRRTRPSTSPGSSASTSSSTAEPRLRRQPEDVLRRGARGRRRHRRHAPPGLPVRRDAHPGAHRPDRRGTRDLMLGSRFLGDPLAGGMPRWKYVSNRFLTAVENIAFGLRLSEYHTGPAGLQPAAARDDPVPRQQRRLRVRPGADRPGRRGRDARADRRDRRSRPATSRRPARSASGGASSTASRRCGSSVATCSTDCGSAARRS